MGTLFNVAAPSGPAVNIPIASGLMTNHITSQLSEPYVRSNHFIPHGSREYVTYNVHNKAYTKDFAMPSHSSGLDTGAMILSPRKEDDNHNELRQRNRRDEANNRPLTRKHSKDKPVSGAGVKDKTNITYSITRQIHTKKPQSKDSNSGMVENHGDSNNTTLINLLWPSSQAPHSDMDYRNNNINNVSASSIPTNYIIVFSTLFFLIGTIGISGNVLVVYIVLSDGKMRRSMTNMMILNLALADSLVMVFGIPEIVMVLLDQGWQLGAVACSVNRTVLVCALYASVLTLVAVCIERYIAIVFPIKAHILCTKRRVMFVIGFIWLFSIACSGPTAVFNTVIQISNTQFCLTIFHDNRTKHDIYLRVFKYSESALFYVGPLIIQVVCYAVIGKRLFVDLDKLHRGGGGGGGGGISSASRPNGRVPTRAFNEAMRARKGVVKMLMASVGIYCLSHSPHQVLLVYNTFSSMTFDETWVYLVFTTILGYVNSAANPFLYCVFSDNFRTNFKRIFHNCMPCKCCCCKICSSCICCMDQKQQRPMTLHSYTEYTSLVRRNTQKQGQAPIITV